MNQIDFRQDLLPLKDKIYRLALRITLNRQEAEDLTQDTLLRAWDKRVELCAVQSLEAYCLTIVRRLALDRLALKEHANASLTEAETLVPDAAGNPEEKLVATDRLQRVQRLFNALPVTLRTALQLRDIEGLSYHEAAEAMGITEGAFKVTLHRARTALRTQYEKIESYGL